jgi:hypothetical protein
MENNLKIFQYSLNNGEPFIDDYYIKSGNLLISKDPEKPTELMKTNSVLIEAIVAYNFTKRNRNRAAMHKALEVVLTAVKGKNINYSEFVSFWPVVDISHSIFMKMNHDEQLGTLKKIIDKYIELRHPYYSTYGYTPTTLQVGKDAKAHKESGNLGIRKISTILDAIGFKHVDKDNADDFISAGDKKYIETDKKGKKLFKKLLVAYGIRFSWSRKKEKKLPDALIKYKKDIFIIEHKHMKESGGGQDKQINEIISLISFKEKNNKIHYISFLDGIYFNLFAKKDMNDGKILTQFENIKKYLGENRQNYFLNTAGFKKLFYGLIKE